MKSSGGIECSKVEKCEIKVSEIMKKTSSIIPYIFNYFNILNIYKNVNFFSLSSLLRNNQKNFIFTN